MATSVYGAARSLAQHPLTKPAIENVYKRVSWGFAAGLGVIVTAGANFFVPPSKQAEFLVWVEGLLTNLPNNIVSWTAQLQPGSLAYDIVLSFVTALVVRFLLVLVPPLSAPLHRFSEILAAPALDVLTQRAIGQSFLAPKAEDRFFVERESVLDDLLTIAENDNPYVVVTVHGPSGIGKTRLALAWVDRLRQRRRSILDGRRLRWMQLWHPVVWLPRAWDAGFIDSEGISLLKQHGMSDWRPLRPTALVLDSTELSEADWRDLEGQLFRLSHEYVFPVRVLLLSYERQSLATPQYERSAASSAEFQLAPLSDVGVQTILNVAVPSHAPTVAETASLMTITGGIPVLVRLMADPEVLHQIANRPDSSPADLLDLYAARIVKTCGIIPFGTEPGSCLMLLQQALATATLAGRLDVSPFVGFDRSQLPHHPSLNLAGDILQGVVPPLLALAYLYRVDRNTNAATRSLIARRAWIEAPSGVAVMIRHYWKTVARQTFLLRDAAPETRSNHKITFADPSWFRTYDALPADASEGIIAVWLESRLDLLRWSQLGQNDRSEFLVQIEPLAVAVLAGAAGDDTVLAFAKFWENETLQSDWAPSLARLDELSDRFPQDEEIQLCLAGGALNATFHHGQAGRWDGMATWLHRLDELSTRFPKNEEIHVCLVRGAFNASFHHGKAGLWDEMAVWLRRLDELSARFPKSEEIQFFLAAGAVNATSDYGRAGRWEEMAAWLRRLDELSAGFPNNEEIISILAKGANNAIFFRGGAGHLDEMATWLRRLDQLSVRFSTNEAIQVSYAKAAVSASNYYHRAGRWEEVATWLRCLDEISAHFPKNEEIQIELAKGVVNAIAFHGDEGHWDEMHACLRRIEELSTFFPKNEEVQGQLAKGALNASFLYGRAEHWDEMAAWLRRLEELCDLFPKNEEIHGQLAKSAVNASFLYGRAGRSEKMAAWLRRLDELSELFPKNEEIQLSVAHGVGNASILHGEARRWDEMAVSLRRVDELSGGFPKNEKFQHSLAAGIVNASFFYGRMGHWDEMAWWLRRLDELSELFPKNEEIQLSVANSALNASFYHGEAGHWDEMAWWLRRLDDVSDRFLENAEFQSKQAKGALDAIGNYGRVGHLEGMAMWLRRLVELSDRFPKNEEIHLYLATAASDILGRPWGDSRTRKLLHGKLAAVARRFPGNLEIQQYAGYFGLSITQQVEVATLSHLTGSAPVRAEPGSHEAP